MRVVVIGAGAIGGTIGARLHQAGYDVGLVARGRHGEATREHGLTFATPHERVRLPIPVYAHPSQIAWRADDVVVLATKSQDTEAAARDLVTAAGPDVPVVSAQNGVANEGALSRWFAHVHGMCVMMPTAHLEPGVVVAHSAAATGILDLGRFPDGVDEVDEAVAAALRAAHIESEPRPDIMRWKYRKLLNNLGNAVQALCGTDAEWREIGPAWELLVGEAEHVFAAAGIDPVTEEEDEARRGDHLPAPAGGRRGTWRRLDLAEPPARLGRRDRLPQWRDRRARPASRRTDSGERADPDADAGGRLCGCTAGHVVTRKPCSPSSAGDDPQPPAKGGRNSTVSPGSTTTESGAREATGRSPTRTEHTSSTPGSREPGCSATARRTTSVRVSGPATGSASDSTPAAERADAQ